MLPAIINRLFKENISQPDICLHMDISPNIINRINEIGRSVLDLKSGPARHRFANITNKFDSQDERDQFNIILKIADQKDFDWQLAKKYSPSILRLSRHNLISFDQADLLNGFLTLSSRVNINNEQVQAYFIADHIDNLSIKSWQRLLQSKNIHLKEIKTKLPYSRKDCIFLKITKKNKNNTSSAAIKSALLLIYIWIHTIAHTN